MRRFHPLLLLALWVMMMCASCGFISDFSADTTPQPDDPRSLKFVPENLPDAQKGVAYEVRIDVENVKTFVGQVKLSQAELPPGLILERLEGMNAARIIGMPLKVGTYSFKIKVECLGTNSPGQVGEKEYTINVKAVP